MVDLPAPLGPTMATFLPGGASKLMSFRASGSVGWYQAYEAREWDSPDPVQLFALVMATLLLEPSPVAVEVTSNHIPAVPSTFTVTR